MKKKRTFLKTALALSVVTAVAVMSTACSSGSSSSAASAGNNADAKTIKIGIINTLPLYLQTDDSGNPAGYDIDILNEMDKRLPQYKFEYKVMDFAAIAVSLESGQLDMGDSTYNRTEERAKKFILPEQCYGYSLDSLVVKKDSGINDLSGMAGKSLAGEPTTVEYQYVVQWNKDHPDKQVKLQPVSGLTTADSYKMVADGRTDAIITYRTSYDDIQKTLKLDNLKLADGIVMKEEFVQMINKKETQLGKDVDDTLKAMLKDGTLGKISKKWFGVDVFTAGSSSSGS